MVLCKLMFLFSSALHSSCNLKNMKLKSRFCTLENLCCYMYYKYGDGGYLFISHPLISNLPFLLSLLCVKFLFPLLSIMHKIYKYYKFYMINRSLNLLFFLLLCPKNSIYTLSFQYMFYLPLNLAADNITTAFISHIVYPYCI